MAGDQLKRARELDCLDPLSGFRLRFFHDDSDTIYLDGNSLGRMPAHVMDDMTDRLRHQWGSRLIRSWNEHWMDLPETTAQQLARLLGARADEILVGDSTSINLYKLAFAALNLQQGRKRIITDDLNFPTDRYILQGLIDHHFPEHELVTVQSPDGMTMDSAAIGHLLNGDTALLTLSHVTYKSAYLYDMEALTAIAHAAGSLVIWDLSHSAGAVPVDLNDSGADMAVGCTYKYLNGGPGAPAYLYVRKDLQERLTTPIQGWFGHERTFAFDADYEPARGIRRFAAGTPHVLSLAPVQKGVEILLEAGMERLRRKSVEQTEFLMGLVHEHLTPLGFTIGTPGEPTKRGSHVTIRHRDGYRINQAMIHPRADGAPVVIPDFRPPDHIRLGMAPLYISFEDIYRAVLRIKDIVETKEYEQFSTEISGVT